MKCMNYNKKNGFKSPLNRSHMISNWDMQYIIGKTFLMDIRYYPCMIQKGLIWKRYERPNFQGKKSLNFGIPTWESKENVSFGCNPPKKS
jgi:hypothetical protein